MKKITNHRFKETYFEETLDNGLHVVLWNKPHYEKSFFMMATPLGALDLHQVDENGKLYEFSSGIAHFLEHKMFEKPDHDVMDEFTAMGANCNAFTSYTETAYYFSTSEDPQEPLNLLMDFVQELDISEESVEKEKGIIIQELEMYQQMSESRIINETMSSLFEEHPLKYDIGGDTQSVSHTTKEELERCYALNYHPSKMILVGVSGKDPEVLMEIIRKNQEKKSFPPVSSVERKPFHEKNEVLKKEHEFKMDISIPKVNIAFKCAGIEDVELRNKKEWCFKMLFDMYFSSLNVEYQTWLDDKIINNSFSYEIDFGKDYGILMFYSESEQPEVFQETVLKRLNTIENIDDAILEQLKRRYFGLSINALTSERQVAITYMRNYFANLDFFASIDVIETITKEDLLKALKEIDLDNFAKIVIRPN